MPDADPPDAPSPLAILLHVMRRKWAEGDHDGAAVLARAAAPYLHARRGNTTTARNRPDPYAISDAELARALLGPDAAGGVAGGDRLSLDVVCGVATSLTITTQGAERLYRALPSDPASRIVTSIDLADGACCDFLPQETILFDRCSLDRQLTINMTGSARFLGIEALIFGRAAMGETVQTARLRDAITLRCDGALRFHEVFRPPGQVAAWRQRPTALGGATAMATILLASPDAGEHLAPLRDALASFQMGASAWDGVLVGRIVAADGAELRRALLASMGVLRQCRAMPRVWSC